MRLNVLKIILIKQSNFLSISEPINYNHQNILQIYHNMFVMSNQYKCALSF